MEASFGFGGEVPPPAPEEKKNEGVQQGEVRGLEDAAAEALAKQKEAEESSAREEERVSPPSASAEMPAFVTRNVEQGLADLGYPAAERNKLSPEQAQEILEGQRRFKKEAQALRAELERMPEGEREKMGVGFQNYGLLMKEGVSNWKSEGLEWIAKTQMKGKGAVAGYLSSLAETYRKDAKKARDSMESYQKARTRGTLASAGYLAGNAVKIGRTIADFTGATAAAPLRYAMMTGMFLSRGADAAKEYRLKNEEVIAKTRIEDADKAAEEAWAVYEEAKEKAGYGEVSAKDFEKAYREGLPYDLLERLNAKTLEQPSLINRAVQGIMKAVMRHTVEKLERKAEKIEKDEKLTPAKRKAKRERLFNRFERRLHDYDRIIGQAGTVDVAAMSARSVEVGAKVVVGAAIAETLGIAFDRFVLGGAIGELIEREEVKDVMEGLRDVPPPSEIPPVGTFSPGMEHLPEAAKLSSVIENAASPEAAADTLAHAESPADTTLDSLFKSHPEFKGDSAWSIGKTGLITREGYGKWYFLDKEGNLWWGGGRLPSGDESGPQVLRVGAAEWEDASKEMAVPAPKEMMEEAGRVMTVEKGGSVSAAAREMVKAGQISDEDFRAAWANPESVVKIGDEEVHVSKAGLVYEGNEVRFVPGEDGTPPRFEVMQGSGKPMGTDADLYNRYGKLEKKPPEWLQKSVLGVTEGEVEAMRPEIEKLPTFERVSVDKLPEIKLPEWFTERIAYAKLAETLPEKTANLENIRDNFENYSLLVQENAVSELDAFEKQLTYLETHADTIGLTSSQEDFIVMSKEAIEEMREVLAESHEAFKEQFEDVGVSYQSYEKAVVAKGLTVKELFDMKKGGSLDEKKWGKFVDWISALRPTPTEQGMKVDEFLRALTPENFHLAKL